MHDLLIKNGLLVDGSGAPGRRADVAVNGGVIVAVGKVEESAREVIDASDLVLSPGFIDPHTHYDAQICWDPMVTPSSWHGVTSVVLGNCGVGIAPCADDFREISTSDLLHVEAIPYDVLEAGITWDWNTFPEYMDAAQRRGTAINLGFIAPLTPFRHWVMGADSMERAATPEETASIAALLRESVAAGALGFSTTRSPSHVGYRGAPLACRNASPEEWLAYCHVLRDLGKGAIELVLTKDNSIVTEEEYALLELSLRESGRPVTWLSLFDRDDLPDAVPESLRYTEPLAALGGRGQVSTRPHMVNIDLRRTWIFRGMTSLTNAPTPETSKDDRIRVYSDPAFRAAFRAELQYPRLFNGRWDRMSVHMVDDPAFAALLGRELVDLAAERGQDPVDTFFDVALECDLGIVYGYQHMNVTQERVAPLMSDPRTIIGLSDAGAHTDMLCDAGYSTYLLGHWVREVGALTLERAVQRLTSEPADFFGLSDRGRVEVGKAADLVVFDPARVGTPLTTEWMHDFPAGGKRLVTKAEGMHWTVVNGTVLYEGTEHTGDLPGTVLRP